MTAKLKPILIKAAWVPGWLVAHMAQPVLPKAHPWKNNPPSLDEWVESGTPLGRMLSIGIGVSTIEAVLICGRVLGFW